MGACEVHIGDGSGGPPSTAQRAAAPPPPPPPPPGPPAPPPPSNPPAPPALAAAPPPPASPPPGAPPQAGARSFALRIPARVVRPPPLVNVGGAQLNVQALKLRLRPSRKCGPREVPPSSGHWVHLDCNLHLALTTAKPYSTRKIKLLLRGALKLDTPVGPAAAAAPAPGASPPSLDRASFAAVLPGEVDHRVDGTEGPIADQGQVGACTAFSLASAMDNAIRRQNKGDTMSPLHIWSHYGIPVMQNAGDGNVNKAISPWEEWPYDERVACEIDQSGDGDCGPYLPPVVPGAARLDPLVQGKIREADSRGRWRVTEYDEIGAEPDAIAAVLATGADVWFSMNIGSTWLDTRGDTVADWNDAQVDGGHAVLFAGYRHKNGQRQFLVHNSWGKDWGDQGFAYVSEAMVKRFIKRAYKVVVADVSQPPPPASDPNALTDDDCGEDQLVDSVTGQCATICPDDSRPANGQCGGATAGAARTPPPATAPPPARPGGGALHLQVKH